MSILKKPLITEKYTAISEKLNKYGFVVAKTASKDEIKKAVECLLWELQV
jgi:large subunit ribosomal protein L23